MLAPMTAAAIRKRPVRPVLHKEDIVVCVPQDLRVRIATLVRDT